MSAPKRKNNLPQVSSSAQDRAEWIAAFRKNVGQDATAQGAWGMIARAGLEQEAIRALWTYSHPPTDFLHKSHRNSRRLNAAMKALIRARDMEEKKRNAGDRRAPMFFDRYYKKHIDVLRSEMPFPGMTVKDWVLARAGTGKVMPGLAQTRKAFASLGPRTSLSDRKFWLFILRCYGKNNGVHLGLERLTALAHCADRDTNLDARTLGRFLASISPSLRFRILPAPSLHPPQS